MKQRRRQITRMKHARTAKFLTWIGLMGLLAPMGVAEATTFRDYSMQEMMDNSSYVVRARVTYDAGYAIEHNGIVCTPFEFEVLDSILGHWPRQSPLQMCAPGGITAEGHMQFVVGAPTFLDGETYVLFLPNRPWRYTSVTNWSNGSLREVTVDGKDALVRSDGLIVTDISDLGVRGGERFDDSETGRRLRSLGIENVEGVAQQPTPINRAAAKAQAAERGILMTKLRTFASRAVRDAKRQNFDPNPYPLVLTSETQGQE